MNLQPLDAIRAQVTIGQPLSFGICDEQGRLLLGPGQVIRSDDQFQALLERGAYVEAGAAFPFVSAGKLLVARARPVDLPGMWAKSLEETARLLRESSAPEFHASLERASSVIVALIERDPDLAIFQIVRSEDGSGAARPYASQHCVHTAIAAHMAATRLGWDAAAVQCTLRTALTMNIAMIDLQNTLFHQVTPVTAPQREAIRSHPQRGVDMLIEVGVRDADWLRAVLQHHETEDGRGYPEGRRDIDPVASLVHRADAFTAKFSPRQGRIAMRGDSAARRQYQSDQGNPMSAALIKDFGLYPPGTTVRLKSGESGIVVRRGEVANAPTLVALADAANRPLPRPLRRDSRQPEHAIAEAIAPASLKVRITQEQLAAIAAG